MTRVLTWVFTYAVSLGLAYAVGTTVAHAVSDSFNQSAEMIEGAGR